MNLYILFKEGVMNDVKIIPLCEAKSKNKRSQKQQLLETLEFVCKNETLQTVV